MLVLTSGNIAYLPITKNASQTFTLHFKKLGWQESQFDLLGAEYEIFGHFRDPIERHFKGTAEFLLKSNITHLVDDPIWRDIWCNAVMDIHSYPITWSVGNRKINWIPISPEIDTVDLTRIWLAHRGIDLGDVTWENKSSDTFNILYQKLRNIELKDKHHSLTYFYDADIVLWNKLLLQYS